MIDSIIGVSMPCKIARLGKSRHGLLKMPVAQSPDSSQLIIDFHNITLVARDNIEHPVKGKSHQGDGRYARVQPDAVYGSAVLYMHPLAIHRDVDPSGRDFSGYVIFTPDVNEKPPGYVAGYRYDAGFAFTQDGDGQGMLARISVDTIRFAKPIRLGESVDFTSPGASVRVDLSSGTLRMFAASSDGRVLYFGRFPSFYDIRDMFGRSTWDEYYKAKIDKISLAGGMSQAGVEISITSETLAVDSIPADIYETEHEHETLYSRSAVYAARLGECVPADASQLVENIKDSTDGYNPPFGRPTAFMSFLREYTRTKKGTVISAALVGDALDYLVFSSESVYEANGSGDINASAEPYVLGGPCGLKPDEYTLIGVRSRFDRWSSTIGSSVSRYKLEGYGGSSVIEYSAGGTSDVVAGWENVDGVTTDYSSQEETSFESLTFDDKVLYYDSSPGSIDGLQSLKWPSFPAMPGFAPESFIGEFLFVEEGESPVGKKATRITVRLVNYHSSDLLALSAVVRAGTVYSDGGEYRISESSHTATLHVGKTFARGVIDSYVYEQDLINEPGRRWRAYDPLDKKVSALYPHPVFYV